MWGGRAVRPSTGATAQRGRGRAGLFPTRRPPSTSFAALAARRRAVELRTMKLVSIDILSRARIRVVGRPRRNGTRWRHCSRAEAALRAHDRGQRLDGGLLPERRDEASYACITSREAMVIDQVLPDGHGVAPPGRRPRRSARGRARRRSPAARGWGGPRTPARRHPCPCRPTVPAKSRWTPPTKWPVLPDARKAGHGPAPPRRPPSGSRWPSRG